MTILPFSTRTERNRRSDEAAAEQLWLSELDAALHGERDDAEAQSWRELREDVRSLAPPTDPEFEMRLQQQLSAWTADAKHGGRRLGSLRLALPRLRGGRSAATRRSGPGEDGSTPGRRRLGLSGARNRLQAGGLAGLAVAVVVGLIVAVALQSPSRNSGDVAGGSVGSSSSAGSSSGEGSGSGESSSSSSASSGGAAVQSMPQTTAKGLKPLVPSGKAADPSVSAAAAAESQSAAPEPAEPNANATEGPATLGEGTLDSLRPHSPSKRVQHRSASLALSTAPGKVQEVSERVARVAVGDGGFVRTSHVEVHQGSESEARMMLSLPSSKLNAALASIERIASVRAKSQSLVDITSSYDAARRRLADANAERQALLRALSKAYTQGEIESLHARLSDAGRAIERASAQLHSVSHRGSTAEVEVDISGHARTAGSSSTTLGTGLHDAGHVLEVALVVLLIGAAALVPLALLIALITLTGRLWRRNRRERALDSA